jgi:carbamoyl-phosphate synthase large subunit
MSGRYDVELIGAKLPAIRKAEDRELFKQAMDKIGVKSAPSGVATTMEEAWQVAAQIGDFPLIIRPAFTLGGSGGGIAYNKDEFELICKSGLEASTNSQVKQWPGPCRVKRRLLPDEISAAQIFSSDSHSIAV